MQPWRVLLSRVALWLDFLHCYLRHLVVSANKRSTPNECLQLPYMCINIICQHICCHGRPEPPPQFENRCTVFHAVPTNCVAAPSTPELKTRVGSNESLQTPSYRRHSSFQGLGCVRAHSASISAVLYAIKFYNCNL